MSEAAARLLDPVWWRSYFDRGVDAVVDAVRAANAKTSFAGLTLAAIDLALETAAADPTIQLLIAQAIRPTPTPVTPSLTPTRTPTPTSCAQSPALSEVVRRRWRTWSSKTLEW